MSSRRRGWFWTSPLPVAGPYFARSVVHGTRCLVARHVGGQCDLQYWLSQVLRCNCGSVPWASCGADATVRWMVWKGTGDCRPDVVVVADCNCPQDRVARGWMAIGPPDGGR
jgi:hypothetical protein